MTVCVTNITYVLDDIRIYTLVNELLLVEVLTFVTDPHSLITNKSFQERKEQQIKIELGEPLPAASSKTQVDLQQRILNILNDKKVIAPEPAPVSPAAPTQSKLLNDPTVRKALDSILQKFT